MWKPSLNRIPAKATGDFQTYVDLLPRDDATVSVRGVVGDERLPCTTGRLKNFIADFNLGALGIGQGDRLCASIPNGPEAALAFLACSVYCTYAPLNPALTAAEVEVPHGGIRTRPGRTRPFSCPGAPELVSGAQFEFEDMPAKAVIVRQGIEHTHIVLDVAKRMNVPVIEMVVESAHVGAFSLRWLSASNVLPPTSRIAGTRQDVCLVLHTSGTTAKPKIVPLNHENLATGCTSIASTLGLTRESVNLNVMPLYHIHAIEINLLASLVAGASTIASPLFDAAKFLDEWLPATAGRTEPQPTWYSSVPTIHQMILAHAEARGLIGPSAETRAAKKLNHALEFVRSESSVLPVPVGERLEALFGTIVAQTYAMTGSMPIAANPRDGSRKLHSVGPSAGPEIRVCDDRGADEVQGKEGEVCVRGSCVTRGYEMRPHMAKDPNIDAFHCAESGSWLRTGDKGYLDEDGYLCLVGRFKEIINRGGEKISPAEVEHVLRRHSAVADMIVFAHPHKQLGEVVGAAVVLRPKTSLSLVELRDFAANALSSRWLPESLIEIEKVPKGSTGKPARIGLAKNLGVAEIDALASANPDCVEALQEAVEAGDEGETISAAHYTTAVLQVVTSVLGGTPDADTSLISAGLTSVKAVGLLAELQKAVGNRLTLSATMLFEHPTARQLAQLIAHPPAAGGAGGVGGAGRGLMELVQDIRAERMQLWDAIANAKAVGVLAQQTVASALGCAAPQYALIGGGGHAAEIIDQIRGEGRCEIAGVFDDDASTHGSEVEGVKVLGDSASILREHTGSLPSVKMRCARRLLRSGASEPTAARRTGRSPTARSPRVPRWAPAPSSLTACTSDRAQRSVNTASSTQRQRSATMSLWRITALSAGVRSSRASRFSRRAQCLEWELSLHQRSAWVRGPP